MSEKPKAIISKFSKKLRSSVGETPDDAKCDESHKEAPRTSHGGGSGPVEATAIVVERVDNGWICRVVNGIDETEAVLIFTPEQRGDLFNLLARCI